MAQQTINVGNTPDDGLGDTLRDAFIKVNANFDELYASSGGGGGGGVTDHGALTGLGDDDHPHYLTTARGDARYYTQSQLNNGSLDSRYYTETELDDGALDSRYPLTGELYGHWFLQIGGNAPDEIFSQDNVLITAGSGINLTWDDVNKEVTIENTSPSSNNYVSAIQFGGSIGDDIVLELPRVGLSTLSLDMTTHMESYFDIQYAAAGHGHTHFSDTNNPHNVTLAQVGADNYGHWKISVDGGLHEEVNQGEQVDFIAGNNISITPSYGSPITMTIDASFTNTNNYVSAIQFGGTLGDDIIVQLVRAGLSTLSLDMTNHMETYFDNVYADIVHSHSHFNQTDNPHNVTLAQVGGDNYNHWKISVDGGLHEEITTGEQVDFIAGSNVTITPSYGATNTITIASSTGDNYYVNSMGFGGLQGDDIVLELGRVGQPTLSLDMTSHMTSYLDTRYIQSDTNFFLSGLSFNTGDGILTATVTGASNQTVDLDGRYSLSGHSHSHFSDTTNPHNVTLAQVGGDNYNHWKLSVDGGLHEEINTGEQVDFIAGNNISITPNYGATNTITIEATASGANYYLSDVQWFGSIGDDIIMEFVRTGLSDFTFDLSTWMEAYFDTRYSSSGHTHSHFSATNNPHSVTASQVGAVPSSGGTFTGDVTIHSGDESILLGRAAGSYSIIRLQATGVTTNNYLISYASGHANHPEFAMKNNQTDGEITFYTNSTKQVTINSSGNVTIAGTSYASNHAESASDIRLKSNLRELDPLEIAEYATAYLYDKETRDTPEISLIAQDMKKANPHLVGSMNHDRYKKILTLSPLSIASVGLAGVKEVNRKTDRQTKLIERLRGRVAELEQEVKRLKVA